MLPLALRVAQIVLAGVVFGLSVWLITDFGPGHNPSIIDYAAFCGAAAIITAAVGIASTFIESLEGIVTLALDAFAVLFLLAAGIAFPTKIKGTSCSSETELGYNSLFWPSTTKLYGNASGDKWAKHYLADTEERCRVIYVDTVFIWICWGFVVATLAVGLMRRNGKIGGAIV